MSIPTPWRASAGWLRFVRAVATAGWIIPMAFGITAFAVQGEAIRLQQRSPTAEYQYPEVIKGVTFYLTRQENTLYAVGAMFPWLCMTAGLLLMVWTALDRAHQKSKSEKM